VLTGLVSAGAFLAMLAAAARLRRLATPVAERIDAVLPQTQCTRCGYSGCRPYAEAIACGEAAINQCPPGGSPVIDRLARITGQAALPLNTVHGIHGPRVVALIDESACIGCTLCVQACPTDAIVGAGKRMHTVITADCTGCELCLPPCPVDCIELVPAPPVRWSGLGGEARIARRWRARHDALSLRRARQRQTRLQRLAGKADRKLASIVEDGPGTSGDHARKRAVVEAAIRRARARLANP
jgi:electron transport complex protein RnfB